jgi:hypothetical protein
MHSHRCLWSRLQSKSPTIATRFSLTSERAFCIDQIRATRRSQKNTDHNKKTDVSRPLNKSEMPSCVNQHTLSCVKLDCDLAFATSFMASRSGPQYLTLDLLAMIPETSSALSDITLHRTMYFRLGSAFADPRLLYCSNASKK